MIDSIIDQYCNLAFMLQIEHISQKIQNGDEFTQYALGPTMEALLDQTDLLPAGLA